YDRLQGRAPPLPLHHRAWEDPSPSDQRNVCAAPAAGEHGDQACAFPRDPAVHRGPRGVTGGTGATDRPVAGWGTAAWLTLSVLLLSALDGLPLVFVPLALLLL